MSVMNLKNPETGQWEPVKSIKGADGYTPVRGEDYWTEEDKREIVEEVLLEVPAITQEAGTSETLVMSQKAVTDLVNNALGDGSSSEYETVTSVEEMTDTTKQYILKESGTLWAYGPVAKDVRAEVFDTSKTFTGHMSGANISTSTNTIYYMPVNVSELPESANVVVEVVGLNFNQSTAPQLMKLGYSGNEVPAVGDGQLIGSAYAAVGAAYIGESNLAWTISGGIAFKLGYLSNAKLADYTSIRSMLFEVQDEHDASTITVTLNYKASADEWHDTGVAPENAGDSYVDLLLKINENTESITALEQEYGVLRGKKIVYDGDSIFAYSRMANPIAEITGGTYENQAVSSAWISSTTEKHSVVNNLSNLPTDGDLYCFEGGINDFWNDVPLGEVTSSYTGTLDTSTVCGALETIFRYAQDNFVGKPVCFVIVHKISNTATSQNGNGVTFTDFHDAMVQVCEKYSIPYYDAFKRSGLNVLSDAQATAYCPDLIHPNDEGHRRYYVPQLLALFREIMPPSY